MLVVTETKLKVGRGVNFVVRGISANKSRQLVNDVAYGPYTEKKDKREESQFGISDEIICLIGDLNAQLVMLRLAK